MHGIAATIRAIKASLFIDHQLLGDQALEPLIFRFKPFESMGFGHIHTAESRLHRISIKFHENAHRRQAHSSLSHQALDTRVRVTRKTTA